MQITIITVTDQEMQQRADSSWNLEWHYVSVAIDPGEAMASWASSGCPACGVGIGSLSKGNRYRYAVGHQQPGVVFARRCHCHRASGICMVLLANTATWVLAHPGFRQSGFSGVCHGVFDPGHFESGSRLYPGHIKQGHTGS